jgi:autotransporter-associated beta strand protein
VIASGNSASLAGLSGAVLFNGGTFHVTADTVSANVNVKYSTSFAGATSSSTATFDVDAGVTLTVGTAGGSANMRTNGGGSHGGTFTKAGLGTLRILSNNGQLDDPFEFNAGTVIVESATGLGGADNSSNHVDMKSGTTLVLRQNAATNFLTPINVVDPGATVNVVLDRQTSGAGVTHSVNALTTIGAATVNFSAGTNVTSGVAGLTIGTATLGGNATLNVGANAAVTVSGVVSGAFGLTKTGAGTLTLGGANTFTGGTTASAGTLLLASADALAGGALAIGSGATVRAQANLPKAVTLSTLTTAGTGVFDLTNNSMVIRGMTAAQVQSAVAAGSNHGLWTGPGINSSTAAATTLTAVGFGANSALGKTAFKGVNVGATDVLLKFTYYGDADLSGNVTLDDFTLFLNGYQTGKTTWFNGDFDYNGQVTLDDFTLFLAGYQNQGAAL